MMQCISAGFKLSGPSAVDVHHVEEEGLNAVWVNHTVSIHLPDDPATAYQCKLRLAAGILGMHAAELEYALSIKEQYDAELDGVDEQARRAYEEVHGPES